MFARGTRQRDSARRILVSTEGCRTEPDYLTRFEREFLRNRVRFDCLFEKGAGSPDKVLDRMVRRMEKAALRPGDEAWLVVDKDRWTDGQLRPLAEWAEKQSGSIRRRLFVSNPKFELWLLLHFEDATPGMTAHAIDGRLGSLIPGYDKSIPDTILSRDSVRSAIARSEALLRPSRFPWPESTGTTIHRGLGDLLDGIPSEGVFSGSPAT